MARRGDNAAANAANADVRCCLQNDLRRTSTAAAATTTTTAATTTTTTAATTTTTTSSNAKDGKVGSMLAKMVNQRAEAGAPLQTASQVRNH